MRFTTAAFVLLLATRASAAEPDGPKQPAAPAPAPAAPAEAKAAATQPADEADAGERAVRVARAFLGAAARSEDKVAYEMTTAAYREGTSPEKFAELLTQLRAKAQVSGGTPVQGSAILKPSDGQRRPTSSLTGRSRSNRRKPTGRPPASR